MKVLQQLYYSGRYLDIVIRKFTSLIIKSTICITTETKYGKTKPIINYSMLFEYLVTAQTLLSLHRVTRSKTQSDTECTISRPSLNIRCNMRRETFIKLVIPVNTIPNILLCDYETCYNRN